MRTRFSGTSIRTTWLLLLGLMASLPFTTGCDPLSLAGGLWLEGYGFELLLMPARSLIGTGLLQIINTY